LIFLFVICDFRCVPLDFGFVVFDIGKDKNFQIPKSNHSLFLAIIHNPQLQLLAHKNYTPADRCC